MKAILPVCLICLCAPLAAQGTPPPVKPAVAEAAKVAPAPVAPRERAKAKPRVRIDTSCGPIVVELEPDLAPRTVANFLRYVDEGFYSDTVFHRVILGFMIQGGGLLKDLSEKPNHGPISNEATATFEAGLRNTPGTLAMARTDNPQSANCQFYINTAINPRLDHKDTTDAGFGYCVFGRVVSGMEVVTRIEQVTTVMRHGMMNVPELPVRIKLAQRLPEVP